MILAFLASTVMAHAAAPTNAELKIGTTQEFDNIHPLITTMGGANYIIYTGLRSLVIFDESGKLVPVLAKSIPSLENKGAKFITENGKKKITATFEILDAASWGDGTPVTCKDFELTVKVGGSPNVAIGETEQIRRVERVDWDPKTPKKCQLTYASALYNFAEIPKFRPLPSHLEGPIFEKHKGTPMAYEQNSLYTKDPTNAGLWNGPYRVAEIKLGSHVRLEPNPKFYGKAPKIKKVYIKLIPNSGTLEANLRSGTIDMIQVTVIQIDQALSLEKTVKSEKLPYTVLFRDAYNYEHLDVNLDHPILSNINVRQALLYGMDRSQLVKALFSNKQQVAISPMLPGDEYFTDDPKYVTQYKYDKKKAIELLEKAGWMPGKDGIRTKDGKRLSFYLMTTAGNKTRENVQSYLMDQWKQIGVEAIIKNEPARVFFGETVSKRKYQGVVMYTTSSGPNELPEITNATINIPTEKNAWAGQNYPGYSNPKVDKLFEEAKNEFNRKKRQQLMYGFSQAVTRDLPTIPLFYRADIAVVPANLKNYKMTGHMYYDTNHIENWSLE